MKKALLNASKSRPLEGGPSFSLSHRLYRLIWMIAWTCLASWTPAPFHRWRNFILRLFGAKISSSARVYPTAKIWFPPNLHLGEHACIGPGVICYSMDRIEVGARTVVSQGAHLCAGSHDIDDLDFQLITAPICIGEGAWIAAEAFIGPGAKIGSGAVVGARAVLFGSAVENGVYVGNPAKFRKLRAIRGRREEPVE